MPSTPLTSTDVRRFDGVSVCNPEQYCYLIYVGYLLLSEVSRGRFRRLYTGVIWCWKVYSFSLRGGSTGATQEFSICDNVYDYKPSFEKKNYFTVSMASKYPSPGRPATQPKYFQWQWKRENRPKPTIWFFKKRTAETDFSVFKIWGRLCSVL